MDTHALEVLEFEAALDHVARHAGSEIGAEAVRALRPIDGVERVRSELGLVVEGIALLAGDEGWTMPSFPDVRAALQRVLVAGSVLDAPTLLQVSGLIGAARVVRRLILARESIAPELARLAEGLADLPAVAAEIDRAISEDGQVRDGASPELARLRREINGARARIVRRLTEFASSLPAHFQVPDASVTIREGRYVVPIRREGRGEVGGIVHGESQTGATLFVEPPVAIEMMNRLRELEAAEAREVQRILRSLTDSLRPHAAGLAESLEMLVRLDTVYARARYALAVDGHVPEVFAPGSGRCEIASGRHPLLLAQGEEVVPFDLRMDEGERTLVISGPNTGGKTVLLKAIGLLALLVRSGVVPPVGPGTRLPAFDRVFADIGDEQSIEASLSTFSAHLRNLRETLRSAGAGSLVLIDEIGSGTDPVEGAALARSILLDLTERGCMTVATTHLGALKLLASEDPRVVNGSLQFDARKLQPTYRFQKGVPGRSYGLAIARRLGLPEEILRSAEESLPKGERDVGRLLLELEAKEQEVERLRADLAAQLARTTELRDELERRQRELTRREKDSERRARQQARDLLLQSRAEVEAAIREIREAANGEALEEAARAARRRVEEAARRQKERTPVSSVGKVRSGKPQELRVGARVRIESIGRTGTLLEIRDSRAVVDADGLRVQLPVEDLAMLPAGDQRPPSSRSRPRPSGGRIDADFDASAEIDLRGMRVDEIALRLGRALDNAILANLPSFRIIHGKGTGALRAQVEELLRADPRVLSYRPGERFEGGTGVTVVEFG